MDYDLANDDRDYYTGGHYSKQRGLSNLEYEAWQNAVFQLRGAPLTSSNAEGHQDAGTWGGLPMLPSPPAWLGQQGAGLPPTAPLQGPLGKQGQLPAP